MANNSSRQFPLHLHERRLGGYFQTQFMCIHKPKQLVTYVRESYNRLLINITLTSLMLQLLMLQPELTVFSKIKLSIKCSFSSSVSERRTAKCPYYIAYRHFNTSAIMYDKLIVIALT